jgi:hypothetical protein
MHRRRHGQYPRRRCRARAIRRRRHDRCGERGTGGELVARGWRFGVDGRYYQEAEHERDEAPLTSAFSGPLECCLECFHIRRHEQHLEIVFPGNLTHALECGRRAEDDDADAAHRGPAEEIGTT